MSQVRYPKPKLAVLLNTIEYNTTAKAGFIVSVIGHQEPKPDYLIAHPKINGHSGSYGKLDIKRGQFMGHCCFVQEKDLLFVVK